MTPFSLTLWPGIPWQRPDCRGNRGFHRGAHVGVQLLLFGRCALLALQAILACRARWRPWIQLIGDAHAVHLLAESQAEQIAALFMASAPAGAGGSRRARGGRCGSVELGCRQWAWRQSAAMR